MKFEVKFKDAEFDPSEEFREQCDGLNREQLAKKVQEYLQVMWVRDNLMSDLDDILEEMDDSEIVAESVIVKSASMSEDSGMLLVSGTAVLDLPTLEDVTAKAVRKWEKENDEMLDQGIALTLIFQDDECSSDGHSGMGMKPQT